MKIDTGDWGYQNPYPRHSACAPAPKWLLKLPSTISYSARATLASQKNLTADTVAMLDTVSVAQLGLDPKSEAALLQHIKEKRKSLTMGQVGGSLGML
eukprot:TRINITY_DN21795_c0_g1_i1.p1 TRINITY_DN21795_c0_g1~~TRINITY_DN21795_c0_g1_i1.p1  ORF type:complete len:106 (-),score=8.72 TRINITY_DN21795_c0_g1_i1:99-392(-)